MISRVAEKVDEFFTVEGLKKHWTVHLVAACFLLGLWLRYRPEQGMRYLQALDPYMIYRMAQHIAFEGNLPVTDFIRYFPYNTPTYLLDQGDLFFPAIIYWLGPFMFFDSFLEWAQFYPAFMGALSVIFAYLLGKELFDKTAGVSAAFFMAVVAGIMHRTSAGFFEKEPIGTFFMMVTLYFFTRGWKRKDSLSGIASGLAFGFFTISWGGANMLWLLYPLVVGTLLLLNEEIEALVRVYTPTVIIGAATGAAFTTGSHHFDSGVVLANIGMMLFLWSRYAVEELELIDKEYLGYYAPSMSIIGVILLALSPFYSDFLAQRLMALIRQATQGGGAVIAGTVAENTPAGISQIVTQLGAVLSFRVHPLLGTMANIVGTWPLTFIGIAMLGTAVSAMVLRKYGVLGETVSALTYYKLFGAVFLTWVLAFAYFFQSSVIVAAAPSILLVLAGGVLLYGFGAFEREIDIEFRWYYILPFLWVLTNVLGAVSKSRLVFLASFSVAMTSGYTFSVILRRANELDYSIIDGDHSKKIRFGVIALMVAVVVLVNGASGYASSQRIGGSPNGAWMQNLDYMKQQTEEGDVILSWWDYGYWFETVGRRAAVADGGNMGYYSDKKYGKVNYPIADYFTSSNPDNYTWLLKKHSVDYIVLDSTMVGKYSAVSQISNRDNSEFNSMITLSTPGSTQQSITQSGGSTTAEFRNNRQRLRLYAPVSLSQTDASINGSTTLETSRGRINIGCLLTDEGRTDFNVTGNAPYCIVEHPFFSMERGLSSNSGSRVVLVPKSIADSTLVRLYLMDGYGIDYLEKVPEGSNGYIRMWEVTDLE